MNYFTARQQNCAKVRFSVVYVCLTVHGSGSLYGTPPYLPTGLQIVQTCSTWTYCTGTHPLDIFKNCCIWTSLHRALLEMFKFVQLGLHCTGTPPSPLDMFKFNHYEARTIDEWPVGIRLKCLIVSLCQIAVRHIKQQIMTSNPKAFALLWKFSCGILGKLNLQNVLKPSNN